MDGCNENVIEFMTNGTRATLSFSQGRYKSAIRKLAEKHPEDCRIIADNEDGSICAHVPVAWIRISPPRQYTEEQRQQMGERLRQNRSETSPATPASCTRPCSRASSSSPCCCG